MRRMDCNRPSRRKGGLQLIKTPVGVDKVAVSAPKHDVVACPYDVMASNHGEIACEMPEATRPENMSVRHLPEISSQLSVFAHRLAVMLREVVELERGSIVTARELIAT